MYAAEDPSLQFSAKRGARGVQGYITNSGSGASAMKKKQSEQEHQQESQRPALTLSVATTSSFPAGFTPP